MYLVYSFISVKLKTLIHACRNSFTNTLYFNTLYCAISVKSSCFLNFNEDKIDVFYRNYDHDA